MGNASQVAQERQVGSGLYSIGSGCAAHVILQVQGSAAGIKAELHAT